MLLAKVSLICAQDRKNLDVLWRLVYQGLRFVEFPLLDHSKKKSLRKVFFYFSLCMLLSIGRNGIIDPRVQNEIGIPFESKDSLLR